MNHAIAMIVCGTFAGSVNGLLGAGGGMILIPLMLRLTDIKGSAIFPTSVSIILPISIISFLCTWNQSIINWKEMSFYLIGSAIGGILAGKFGHKIPVLWLHRILGVLILWGGIRYLC